MSRYIFQSLETMPYTWRGITYSNGSNGAFNVSGTASALSFMELYNNQNTLPAWFSFDKEIVLDITTNYQTSDRVYFQIYFYDSGGTAHLEINTAVSTTINIPRSTGYTGALIRLRVGSGATINGSIQPVVYTNPYYPQFDEYSPDNIYTSPYYAGQAGNYYAMPNCTRYCYGRWWSFMGSQPSGLYGLGNAEDWWSNVSAYQRGQVPKLGAIACFADGPYSGLGHVAIVEKIYADGSVLFSNSAYKGAMFYLRCGTIASNYHTAAHGYRSYESSYRFQGFIYYPDEFDNVEGTNPPAPPGPNPEGYGMNPLIRYYAKKQIYRNQGRGSAINYHII